MGQFIVNRALTNVWCNPILDNPSILKLTKLTGNNGIKESVELMGKNYTLPVSLTKCHIYQVGQLWPTLVNMFPIEGAYVDKGWVRMDKLCNERNIIFNFYNDQGVNQPLHRTWYRFNEEHGLFICVEHIDRVKIDYNKDSLYMRTYANKWFNSDEYRKSTTDKSILVIGETIDNSNKLMDWQNTYNVVSNSKNGNVIAYVNGIAVSKIDFITTSVRDVIELVYDPTIVKYVDFNIKDLPKFNSILDNGNSKYLLHYPDDHSGVVEFYDDNEIYIFYKYTEKGSWLGRYYHRNKEDSVRMLTHRDYSLNVDYVRRLAEHIRDELNNPIPIDNMYIRLYIRKTPINKTIDFENSRIHELYNLSDDLILRSMTGVDSVVDEWKAENLENSYYTKLMRTVNFLDVNDELVEQAYGYNAMSVYTGYTPQRVEGDEPKRARINHLYNKNCTVYEYSSVGRMLGAYVHKTGINYTCSNRKTCSLIEVYTGEGTDEPSVKYGLTDIELVEGYNYRVYLCDNFIENQGIENKYWRDITGDESRYKVEDNKVVWLLDSDTHMLQVRFDDKFLMYNLTLELDKGILKFPLKEISTINLVKEERLMSVPMGELDVYLNGYNLIEGVDYYVRFPYVYIVNKKYLKQTNKSVLPKQNVHVRFCGFCNKDMSRDAIDDQGFIVHGVLSNNNIYDIRSDKVLHIVVDGCLKTKDEVRFSEFTEGSDKLNKYNGLPYMIRDIVVPLQETTHKDTYYYRDKSISIDKKISDYMTIKFPQPEREVLSAIPYRHTVASPFMSAVIEATINEEILIDKINLKDTLSVRNSVSEYIDLLEVDPIGNNVNSKFVVVHPCYTNNERIITAKQLKYLRAVVNTFCKQLIDLTSFLKVNKG